MKKSLNRLSPHRKLMLRTETIGLLGPALRQVAGRSYDLTVEPGPTTTNNTTATRREQCPDPGTK